MHDDLKSRLRDELDSDLGFRPPRDLTEVLRRGRGKRLALRLVTTASVVLAGAALVGGGFSLGRALSTDEAGPIRPAEEKDQGIEPMGNGRILQANAGYWVEDTAPPAPGGEQTYSWNGFDQDTGSFLYYTKQVGRVWVVGADGLAAELDCSPSPDWACGRNEIDAFGPGPDELTVPSADDRSVHVIGFDGTLRDTLDISAVVRPGERVTDLAWSPDGEHLAVSTNRDSGGCDGSDAVSCVWIFARDGGVPVPASTFAQSAASVYAGTEPVIRDLSWSPDGHTLALLVAPSEGFCEGQGQAGPRLVTLSRARGIVDRPINQAVSVETLHTYDDWGLGVEGKACVVADDYHVAFPFAWSPDGTRIAVTSGGGVAEISAENGEVLARHQGEGPEGPLAWLRER